VSESNQHYEVFHNPGAFFVPQKTGLCGGSAATRLYDRSFAEGITPRWIQAVEPSVEFAQQTPEANP
jgi:hypothetical protein